MIKIVVFASGKGTNAQNIMEFAAAHATQLEVVGIITDQPTAGVIAKAAHFGVPCQIYPYQGSRRQQEAQIQAQLTTWQAQWILLAGYMRILSPKFVQHFFSPARQYAPIVNIHPSLLPAFPGKDGYRDAFTAGVKYAGITLHFVDAGIDTGPIIAQEIFPRLVADHLADFQMRGLEKEYQLYRRFLTALIAGNGQLAKINNHYWIN